MKIKVAIEIGVKAIALTMGLTFPYVPIWGKVIFLIVFWILRIRDIENDKKWTSVSAIFLIGMIVAYMAKQFL
ncbi:MULTISPECIES: hypothetical protein [Paenibacillus]|uniref:Uncharacterized protein n=1 Tax=Paenibacillus barengoltzii J12 TaxID=935846 RepID=A0ABY1LU93_9BACL|nr:MULTISPECIES: hypothetical protein [Paenibacillus]MDU0329922.1 hypothetical protein [Paenibacillus sp. 3LSP]SMF00341.1 hypothetical protein SAMN02744124_00762 [Paenibacillus barengoltzii J12]